MAPLGRGETPHSRSGQAADPFDTVVHLSSEARELLARRDGSKDVVVRAMGSGANGDLTTPVWSRAAADDPDVPGAPAGTEAGTVADAAGSSTGDGADPTGATDPTDETGANGAERTATGQKPLSSEQQHQVEQLRARDTEVRAHEAAHAAAAGSLGGRTSLDYANGPDGKRYAVGGEVSIDTSPGRTPEETIARARTIRSAALAPASPSAQDMSVASSATQMEAQARSAIRERQQIEASARTDKGETKGETKAETKGDPASRDRAATSVEAAEGRDPDMMLLELSSQQTATRGGMNHGHLASDCGTCRRSVSAYS